MTICASSTSEYGLPYVRTPNELGIGASWEDLAGWAAQSSLQVRELLNIHGAILFRGFCFGSAHSFRGCASSFCPSLHNYAGGNSPRTRVEGNIFTTTEYPAGARISLHNEASYLRQMPQRILFYCETPPTQDGQTPLADCRRIYGRLHRDVREKFERRGVMYVNNLNGGCGVGRSWQAVFQTQDRRAVEARLQDDGYEYEWTNDNGLRTAIVAQATAVHPNTKEPLWINQAEQWHPSSLPPETRRALASIVAERDFPHNAFFGDGSPLDEHELAHIRQLMREEERVFHWAAEDLLVCDNFMVMHGREPFQGPRRILCALG